MSTPFLPPPTFTGAVHSQTVNTTSSGTRPSTFDARQIALLQLCFDESELAGPTSEEEGTAGVDVLMTEGNSFDPAQFVREKCTHVGLATLVRDLEFYAKDVDERVMKRIHEDVHESFIDVSGQLVGMQDQLRQVLTPLDEVSSRVKHATDGLQEREILVHSLCEEIQGHEMERQFNAKMLELLLTQEGLNNHLNEAENLLISLQNQGATATGTDLGILSATIDQLVQSLHRTAIDVQRLEALTSGDAPLVVPPLSVMLAIHQEEDKGSKVPLLVEGLKLEAADALTGAAESMDAFYAALDSGFVLSYGVMFDIGSGKAESYGVTQSVVSLLKVYKLLGEEHRCCEQYSQSVVKPLVEEVLVWKDQAIAKTEDSMVKLQLRLEKEVFSFLPTFRCALLGEDSLGSIVSHSGATAPTHHNISIISQAVWPAVSDTISKRMGHLFKAGIPATFHRHFLIGQKLVTAVESQCVDLTELAMLRASSTMIYWKTRWPLDVYHNLLQTDLMKGQRVSFEKPLTSSTTDSNGGAPWNLDAPSRAAAAGNAHFQSTVDFCSAASWYFSADRILYPLVTRCVRDVVGSSLHLYTDSILQASSSAALGQQQGEHLLAVSCKVLQDFQHVQYFLSQRWVAMFQAAMDSDDDPSVTTSATQLVKYVQGTLAKQATSVLTTMIVHLTNQVDTEHLVKIKTIKGKYWATKKPCPTTGSDFMRDCLKGSVNFKGMVEAMSAGGAGGQFLLPVMGGGEEMTASTTGLSSFLQEVAAACCQKLLGHCKKTMLDAKKVQDMARGKNKDGVSSSSSDAAAAAGDPPSQEAMSDSDKMAVQVYRDIESFGDQLGTLGITKESFSPFKGVQSKVGAKGKWLLGLLPGIPMPPDVAAEDE